MNAETSVAKVGFFGNMYQKLWCLTHIETLRYLLWILCMFSLLRQFYLSPHLAELQVSAPR